MAARRHPLRDHVLARIRRGEFASVREIMVVATLPRQTVNRWLREAKVDLKACRMRYVARLHRQAERLLEGKAPAHRPAKAQMRRELEQAIRKFNEANAGKPG